jgi:hypothetical protein
MIQQSFFTDWTRVPIGTDQAQGSSFRFSQPLRSGFPLTLRYVGYVSASCHFEWFVCESQIVTLIRVNHVATLKARSICVRVCQQ